MPGDDDQLVQTHGPPGEAGLQFGEVALAAGDGHDVGCVGG